MMTHPNRMVNHQSASSCIARLRVLVLSGCRVRSRRRAILQHTPRLSTRVVQFKRLELQLLPHRTSSICARALREFIFSELPQHRQVFTFTSTSAPLNRAREENFSPWPRTLSPLPASYCITNSAANQHHSVRGSIQRELVEVMELQGSGCRTTFNIASRESRR